jgi:hypothetical protein
MLWYPRSRPKGTRYLVDGLLGGRWAWRGWLATCDRDQRLSVVSVKDQGAKGEYENDAES